MFQITKERTFTHAVKILVPIDGGHREESCKATYRVLPVEQVDPGSLTSEVGTREFLRAAIVRLDDLVDDANQAVPYSDEVRDAVLSLPYARHALARTYFDAVNGAAAKN